MKAFVLSALIVGLAGQAKALSCVRPDVAHSYERAAQAEERFIILLGTFAFGDVPSSQTGNINQPREVEVRSRFEGAYLTQEGFVEAPTLAVDLNFTCAASWCGSLTSDGAEVLAFVEQTATGYELHVGPCGGTAFRAPTPEQIAQVQSCIRGEGCEAGLLR